MRNLIIILCMLCAPTVYSRAQYSVEAQIIASQQQLGQPQAQPQAFTDSPDANIISFSPERTRIRPTGAASPRSRSGYNPQSQPVIPDVPEKYYSPQLAAQVPQVVPQVQQPYVPPPVQSQSQPQTRDHSRQQYPNPATDEASQHHHPSTTPIAILKLDKSQSLDGSYKQSWESANNIIVEETGYLKDNGPKDEKSLVQQGMYSYQTPDGTVITTSYTADEGGFKVEGSHLPTPPPIPDEIQRGLNQIYEGIRLQQEIDAKEIKEGKARPKVYDDETGLLVEDNQPNYPQNQIQQTVSQRRQHNQYQPAVQPQQQPVQPVQQNYQPQNYQVPDQTQLFQRQQYRQ